MNNKRNKKTVTLKTRPDYVLWASLTEYKDNNQDFTDIYSFMKAYVTEKENSTNPIDVMHLKLLEAHPTIVKWFGERFFV